MNARIRSLIDSAEMQLSAQEQESLADLLQDFLDGRHPDADLTADELAHLRMVDAEPFEPADPAQVAAYFARRA
jgi:hypothetical protein